MEKVQSKYYVIEIINWPALRGDQNDPLQRVIVQPNINNMRLDKPSGMGESQPKEPRLDCKKEIIQISA